MTVVYSKLLLKCNIVGMVGVSYPSSLRPDESLTCYSRLSNTYQHFICRCYSQDVFHFRSTPLIFLRNHPTEWLLRALQLSAATVTTLMKLDVYFGWETVLFKSTPDWKWWCMRLASSSRAIFALLWPLNPVNLNPVFELCHICHPQTSLLWERTIQEDKRLKFANKNEPSGQISTMTLRDMTEFIWFECFNLHSCRFINVT